MTLVPGPVAARGAAETRSPPIYGTSLSKRVNNPRSALERPDTVVSRERPIGTELALKACPVALRRGRRVMAEQNMFQRVTNVPLITDVAGSFWAFLDFSIVLRSRRKSLNVSDFSIFFLVLPDRIELSTSPLPRECSTTELRQQNRAFLQLP